MIQVYRFDIDGRYIEPVVLLPNEPIPKDCTPIPIPQPCWKPIFDKVKNIWVEMVTEEELLIPAKTMKDKELNLACKNAIFSGFTHTINGVTYWFSFDAEAQSNFQGSRPLLKEGLIPSINWTVRIGSKDGEYSRVPITADIMDELTIAILQHKDSNISKYRDTLLPQVQAAKTVEEVNSITW